MPGVEEAIIGEELLGGGEALAATEAAAPAVAEGVTAAEAAAPAVATTAASTAPTTAEIGLETAAADSTIPTAASTAGASASPYAFNAPGGVGATTGSSMGIQATTPVDFGYNPEMPVSSAYDITSSAPIASESAAAGAAAEAPSTVDKALRYLGVTSPTGVGPTAVPLAALGISQYRANKQAQKIEDQLKAAAAQTKGVATSLIDKYQTGTIDPAQQKQIDDLTNNTKARIKQRYAQMGRDPNTDSAAQSELAKADADSIAMQDAAKQGILTQGLNAAGLAQGPATSAVMAGYQNDLAQQQAMQNFMNTLALMQSRAASTTAGA